MTEPQFPPVQIADMDEESQWLQDAFTPSRDPNLLDFEAFGVVKTVSNIMLEIRHASCSYSTSLTDVAAPDSTFVQSLMCSILQRLLFLWPLVEDGPLVVCISECCRLAASLLLCLPWVGNYPDPTFMINALLYKLKASLGCMVSPARTENQLLVWLLSVGGVLAYKIPERGWFVSQLVEVVTDLDIKSWDAMKGFLLKVLWFDPFCESPFRLLWEEVIYKKECLELINC
jgi:hypothetical protein